MLLRTAVADMDLHSSFQSILLGKLACCLSALIRIRSGQSDSEAPTVDLESQPTMFIIVGLPAQVGMLCRVLCPPLFERSIVCLDFDSFAGFVKIDADRFLPLVFILPSFLPVLQKQARFQDFLSALYLQKQGDF